MTLHHPGNCGAFITKSLLPKRSNVDDDGIDAVFAHIAPKLGQAPVSATQTPFPSSSQALQPAPPVAGDTSSISKRKASNGGLGNRSKKRTVAFAPDTAASAEDTAPPPMFESSDATGYFVRLGTLPSPENEDKSDPKMQIVIVAEMKKATRDIVISSVSTFTINGINLGRCEEGKVINTKVVRELQPDEYWQDKRSKQDLVPLIATFVDGGGVHIRQVAAPTKKKGKAQKDITQPVSPVMPPVVLKAATKRMQTIMPPSKALKDISVVAIFVNGLVNKNLGVDSYVQVHVSPSDTYSMVSQFLRTGDDNFPGIKDKVDSTKLWWDTEIFVLPQIPGCNTLYSWKKERGLRAGDFLCGDDDWPLELFMEFHIIPHKEKAEEEKAKKSEEREARIRERTVKTIQKDEEEKREGGMSAGLLSRVPQSLGQTNSSGQAEEMHEPRKKKLSKGTKTTTPKSKPKSKPDGEVVESDGDESEDGGGNMGQSRKRAAPTIKIKAASRAGKQEVVNLIGDESEDGDGKLGKYEKEGTATKLKPKKKREKKAAKSGRGGHGGEYGDDMDTSA